MDNQNQNSQPSKPNTKFSVGSIYPEIKEKPQPNEEHSEASNNQGAPNRWLWIKIVLLGFFVPIFIGLVYAALNVLLAKLILSAGTFTIPVIHLLSPIYLALILGSVVSYIMICSRYLKRFSRWSFQHPTLIPALSFIFMFLSYNFISHITRYNLLNIMLTGKTGHAQQFFETVTPYAIPVLSAFGLAFFTFMLERSQKTKKLNYPIIVLLLVAPLAGVIFIKSGPAYVGGSKTSPARYPSVKDVSWALVPTKLPAGVDPNDSLNDCPNEPGGYNLLCEYYFTNYPGYLSQSTQTLLVAHNLNQPPASGAFIDIQEAQSDEFFRPYMYSNGNCDILNLEIVMGIAQQYRKASNSNIPAPDFHACAESKTPGGTTLISQDDHLINSPNIKVSRQYYFVKNSTVVVINILQPVDLTNELSAAYILDPNFMPQFYSFVDSFQKP